MALDGAGWSGLAFNRSRTGCLVCTMVHNKQECRHNHKVTCSSIRLFAHTVHSFACSTLFALFLHLATLIHLLACTLASKLVEKWMIECWGIKPLWSGSTKNRDVSTGALACPFARSLAHLHRSLIRLRHSASFARALRCVHSSICSFAHSLSSSWESV